MTTTPPPPRTQIPRELATAHGLASYGKLPHHRSYAVDDGAALSFGAISAAYAERRDSFVDLLGSDMRAILYLCAKRCEH